MDSTLYSTGDASSRLGIGKTFLYKMIAEGRIKTIKLGKRRLVPAQSIVDLIENASAEGAR
jgi:excisionase family DNA binding protein